MAEIVATTTLNVMQGGKAQKKNMYLFRRGDPKDTAQRFCRDHKLPDRECNKAPTHPPNGGTDGISYGR
jgi:hypothetical protein